jgi:hypothetical protein
LAATLTPLGKDTGEVSAVPIENYKPENCHDDGHQKSARKQQQVIEEYVNNHWSKQYETKGHVPIYEQQCTANDLKPRDDPKVMRLEQGADKLSGQACGHWSHGHELKETI